MLLLLLMFAMMVWWNCCYVYMIYAAQVEYTNRHDKQVNIREELLGDGSFIPLHLHEF